MKISQLSSQASIMITKIAEAIAPSPEERAVHAAWTRTLIPRTWMPSSVPYLHLLDTRARWSPSSPCLSYLPWSSHVHLSVGTARLHLLEAMIQQFSSNTSSLGVHSSTLMGWPVRTKTAGKSLLIPWLVLCCHPLTLSTMFLNKKLLVPRFSSARSYINIEPNN